VPQAGRPQHAYPTRPVGDGPARTAPPLPEPPIPPQHFSFDPPPARPDHFASGPEQEPPYDDRHPIVVWIADRTVQEWAIAVAGLGIVVLLCLLLFGGSDETPPRRVTPTVTVTVVPSAAPTTAQTTGPDKPAGEGGTPSGDGRSPQPTTEKTP
ncbi:hypothetical protein AB0K37_06140, partial [Actinomadura sp. NPDC049753]